MAALRLSLSDLSSGVNPSSKDSQVWQHVPKPKPQPKGPRRLEVCVLGEGSTGKTSIAIRLSEFYGPALGENFVHVYDPTLEEKVYLVPAVDISGEVVEVRLNTFNTLDHNDPERSLQYLRGWFRESDACILVCALTSRRTLDSLRTLWRELSASPRSNTATRTQSRSKPIWVIGNKIDCHDRELSNATVQEFAKSIGGLCRIMSAKTGEGCEGIAHDLASSIVTGTAPSASAVPGFPRKRQVKALLLGMQGSGKHSIVDRMLGLTEEDRQAIIRSFDGIQSYDAHDYHDYRTPPFDINGESVEVCWTAQHVPECKYNDTNFGLKLARELVHEHDVCMFVYSVTSVDTFKMLLNLWAELHRDSGTPSSPRHGRSQTHNALRRLKPVSSKIAPRCKQLWIVGAQRYKYDTPVVSATECEKLAAELGGRHRIMSAWTLDGWRGFALEIAKGVMREAGRAHDLEVMGARQPDDQMRTVEGSRARMLAWLNRLTELLGCTASMNRAR